MSLLDHFHSHCHTRIHTLLIKFLSLSLSSGPFHRDRRRYLRTALMELNQLLSDSPGLLGPKVSIHINFSTSCFR